MPRFEFAPFLLDLEARILLRNGEPVLLAGKSFDTLAALVQNRGRLVGKDELLSLVWPGVVVEEASLSQSIFTVRKTLGDTPKEHRYIATVAGRGYQFVAPVQELTNETVQPAALAENRARAPEPKALSRFARRHRKASFLAFVGALATLGVIWLLFRVPAELPSPLVERRLTFNSSANAIDASAISPDSNYLAYSDRTGIHVRLISSGADRLISSPDPSAYVASWFPSGTELLAHSNETVEHGTMWALSIMGRSSRELRTNAWGWGVSPDGKRIAFSPRGAGGYIPEIWLMDAQGENSHKILGLAPGEFLWSVKWSPDGHRLAYLHTHDGGQSVETCDWNGTNRTSVLAFPGPDSWARSIGWLPNRRMVLIRAETADLDANLWQIGVDPFTGKATSPPKRITQWTGTDALGLTASADGKRLVLQKVTYPAQIYIGETAGANSAQRPRRLTDDEAHNWATAWTADSKAVLFVSNRGGTWGVFKQSISPTAGQGGAPEPLVEGLESANLARLGSDGSSVLYMETLTIAGQRRFRLMRVPVNGGLPKLVLESEHWQDYQCARAPAGLCVLLEENQPTVLTATAFDLQGGKGKLLNGLPITAGELFTHSLSPDGSFLAVARAGERDTHVRLLSLTGGSDRELVFPRLSNVESMEWGLDGKGLLCGSRSAEGSALFYLDLAGNSRLILRAEDLDGGTFIAAVPSPDGRYLALCGAVRNSNAWMLENF